MNGLRVYKLIIALLVAICVYQMFRWHNAVHNREIIVYSDTIIHTETIKVFIPVPKDSIVIRWITKDLPVSSPQDSMREETASKEHNVGSTITSDSVSVQIPITQKKYEGDGYKAYISGYMPQLDSFFMYPKSKTIYIKPSRLGIGIQAGVGVCRDGKLSPYIGIGVNYRLFDIKRKR